MANEDVKLKEYIESKLVDIDKRTEQARVSMEKRLDAMNEFRDALRDQSVNSPTRSEVNSKFDAIENILDELKTYKAITESKASAWLVWVGLFFTGASFFFSIAGLSITVYVAFFK